MVNLSQLQQGTVTIAGTALSATYTFISPESDSNYLLFLTVASSVGSPAANCFIVQSVNLTATTFTITARQAPGSGNSITFNWMVSRVPRN